MSPPNSCRLLDLLAISHPVLQGGMTWVGRHELAAAVCEAGALGVIGSGGMQPDELREEIRALRGKTRRSFGVNVPLVNVRPDGDDDMVERLMGVVLDEQVPVVVTGAGSARRFTALLKGAGSVVIHVVPSAGLALKAEQAGVDAIVAESYEAGGHLSANGLSTFALLPQVIDAVRVPVIAAGGISDARGMAAALMLGASAVQLGTRFLATTECNAHPAFKAAIVAAGEGGTLVYSRSQHASRALATPAVRHMVELEDGGCTPEELRSYRGRDRARRGCLEGDLEQGILPAGAAAGLVDAILPAREVVRELVEGCAALFADARLPRPGDLPYSRVG